MPSSEPLDPVYRIGEFQLIADDRILLREVEFLTRDTGADTNPTWLPTKEDPFQ